MVWRLHKKATSEHVIKQSHCVCEVPCSSHDNYVELTLLQSSSLWIQIISSTAIWVIQVIEMIQGLLYWELQHCKQDVIPLGWCPWRKCSTFTLYIFSQPQSSGTRAFFGRPPKTVHICLCLAKYSTTNKVYNESLPAHYYQARIQATRAQPSKRTGLVNTEYCKRGAQFSSLCAAFISSCSIPQPLSQNAAVNGQPNLDWRGEHCISGHTCHCKWLAILLAPLASISERTYATCFSRFLTVRDFSECFRGI